MAEGRPQQVQVYFDLGFESGDPREVSDLLGVAATTSGRAGEMRRNPRTGVPLGMRRDSWWSLESGFVPGAEHPCDWVDGHVQWLLARLLPRWSGVRARFPDAVASFYVSWWCERWDEGWGPILGSRTVQGMAELRADIGMILSQDSGQDP